MERRYVDQLTAGDSVDSVFLVAEKQVRMNRQGAPFLVLNLRDRTGIVEGRLWNVSDEQARGYEIGQYVHARGKVQLFQGSLQVILTAVERVDGSRIDPEEFLPPAAADVDGLLRRLREILLGMSNPHLRALVECFLIDDTFLRKFTAAPAGVRKHHAYRGGLLEHVTTLLTSAHRIADLYPALDRDLLLTGIFLHDLGKIDELSYEHVFQYTDGGQLVGHVVMGVCLLREKVRKAVELLDDPFPDELRLRLEHMIVSHHGTYEFGSPKLPMTLEAIALHHLDSFDAKLAEFSRELEDGSRNGGWTAYDPSLNRRLFRGSQNGTAAPTDG
jgi:3'-5' exoribonuclease